MKYVLRLIGIAILIELAVLILRNQVVFILPQNKLIFSFIVGAIGSAAYITALYFRLVGRSDVERKTVLAPFMEKYSLTPTPDYSRCFWYLFMGGAIATVFQVDVDQFVAVQSLILGATWPAVISQFLSERMTSLTEDERKEIDKDIGPGKEERAVTISRKKTVVDKLNKFKV